MKSQTLSHMPAGTDFKSVHRFRKQKRELIKEGVQLETASDEFFEKVKNQKTLINLPKEKEVKENDIL